MSPTDDEAMMEHIKELLTEVGEEESEEAVEGEDSNSIEYTEENMERAEKIAQILDTDGTREEDEDEPMEG